ncbi:Hemolysin-III protein [Cordyceps fumosorosea ARSEF 2679]|uniref:Hemolysin-III protein n=1 Tax=Cordyceps fumosorosea (strain ARSEF 2679) TaxID=1081104 RepID=A0A162JHE8_CORFA|nr:Hemolysin-III protein [Cordyceps fumosorosea ARSEF 2679]OAA69012.1 Hemolysin-III protein [Cordyceps fumosorosea ARSEF 2679]
MSQTEIKKRHTRDAAASFAMDSRSAVSPANERRTLTWDEVSEWRRDNKYIRSGYRREKADYLEILTSLTFLHNETCNVYTHLIGAPLLPLVAAAVMRGLSQHHLALAALGTNYTSVQHLLGRVLLTL